MTQKFVLAASAACLALSACGSSNGSSGALTSGEVQNLDATYADYEDRIESGELTTTSPEGRASMTGFMGFDGIDPEDTKRHVVNDVFCDVS